MEGFWYIHRSSIKAVADFKAITCLPPQVFNKSIYLDFTTSPAIFFRPCVGVRTLSLSFGLCTKVF